jgi:hypothetical protein
MRPTLVRLVIGLSLTFAACTCQPLIDPPDAGGAGGGTAAGGGAATGGGAGGGGGGGSAVDAGSFTDFVKSIIASDTNETATPRPASEFENLPDDHAGTFPGYFP